MKTYRVTTKKFETIIQAKDFLDAMCRAMVQHDITTDELVRIELVEE